MLSPTGHIRIFLQKMYNEVKNRYRWTGRCYAMCDRQTLFRFSAGADELLVRVWVYICSCLWMLNSIPWSILHDLIVVTLYYNLVYVRNCSLNKNKYLKSIYNLLTDVQKIKFIVKLRTIFWNLLKICPCYQESY